MRVGPQTGFKWSLADHHRVTGRVLGRGRGRGRGRDLPTGTVQVGV